MSEHFDWSERESFKTTTATVIRQIHARVLGRGSKTRSNVNTGRLFVRIVKPVQFDEGPIDMLDHRVMVVVM